MQIDVFNEIVRNQLLTCESFLLSKGEEYAPDIDRLAHFKKAAAIIGGTPKEALLGMLTKHLVSIAEMCRDEHEHGIERWTEKITDSINYLLLLKALVAEEEASHG